MFAFTGFNGFGQFGAEHERRVTRFKEFKVEELESTESNQVTLISPAWNYTAFARGRQLLLKGFLSDEPDGVHVITAPWDIYRIAACDRFCLVLCVDGKLYKVLPSKDGELCEVKLELDDVEVTSSSSSSALPPLPQKRSIFGELKTAPHRTQGVRVKHIACGASIAVAITATNAVYSIPSKIHQLARHDRVQQLACGFEHALLLTRNGDIYAWGYGLRCQLGQEEVRNEEAPILVEALAGVKITYIAAAGWHSAAISAFGDLYTWGFNTNGQLGLRLFQSALTSDPTLKNPSVYPLPQIIDLPKCQCKMTAVDEAACGGGGDGDGDGDDDAAECPPLKVYAGARHTMVLRQCGALYAVGWNQHGQLGIGHTPQAPIDAAHRTTAFVDGFERVESPFLAGAEDNRLVEVICAAWCTVLRRQTSPAK